MALSAVCYQCYDCLVEAYHRVTVFIMALSALNVHVVIVGIVLHCSCCDSGHCFTLFRILYSSQACLAVSNNLNN